MTNISELHRRWSKDTHYKNAYDALGEEFDLARTLIEARTAAGLSQLQLPSRSFPSRSVRDAQGRLACPAEASRAGASGMRREAKAGEPEFRELEPPRRVVATG